MFGIQGRENDCVCGARRGIVAIRRYGAAECRAPRGDGPACDYLRTGPGVARAIADSVRWLSGLGAPRRPLACAYAGALATNDSRGARAVSGRIGITGLRRE